MHVPGILTDLVVIIAAALIIISVFRTIRLPVIVGFIATGILIGPHSLQLIKNITDVQTLAEVGVILLLFAIGLEFSLRDLGRMKTQLLIGGGAQILATVGLVAGILSVFEVPFTQGLFIGLIVSLSSTAIVMKILSDRQETHSVQGKLSLAILLFQDLAFVPMILLVPVLAQTGEDKTMGAVWSLMIAAAVIAGIIAGARYLMPWVMKRLVGLHSREVFVLGIVLVMMGTAWLTSLAGLSLALGAFVAGLVLSESEYSHQIVSEITPMRDALASLFFISIGMLVNLGTLVESPILIIAATAGMMLIKIIVILGVTMLLRLPFRIGVLVGLALAQIGEFSFILAGSGLAAGLIDERMFQVFIGGSVISMMLTPLLIAAAPMIANWMPVSSVSRNLSFNGNEATPALRLSGHVAVVGYGLNGKNLATVLRETGIPYIIVDLNDALVRNARRNGEHIIFGDATSAPMLHHLKLTAARVLVVTVPDPRTARHIVRIARSINSNLHILVRTRYVAEIEELRRMGASQVIPEEFETSIEIFTRVLREYHIPRNVIMAQVDLLRREGYSILRGQKLPESTMSQIEAILAAGTTDTFLVLDESPACGKTLGELNIQKNCGALVIAVVRGDKPVTNPPAIFRIERGDILMMMGTHAEIDSAFSYLTDPHVVK